MCNFNIILLDLKTTESKPNSFSVKGVNFYGPRSEYVLSGSDCGNIFFWDKDTESIVRMVSGDKEGVVRPFFKSWANSSKIGSIQKNMVKINFNLLK